MVKIDRVDVFISSVMNELEYDREIVCEMINSISLNSTMFEMFPSMAESPTEAYLEKVRNCNIFILILWKSFTDAVYSEYNEAIRKNKPVLIFLKSLKDDEKRSLEIISFIKNIESAVFKATIYKQYRTIEQLRQEVKKAISNEIAKNYEIPRISQTREDLYELGGSIINQSYNRIFIFEKTPCLFLGSRDYLSSDDKKVSYEAKVVSILSEWIEKSKNKDYTEFLSLFSIEKTKAELNPLRNNKEYLDKVRKRIIKYKQYEEDTGFRFRFLPVQLPISGWMIVGDIYYAMWFIGESTALSQKNEKISNEIVNQLKRSHDIRLSANELFIALDL